MLYNILSYNILYECFICLLQHLVLQMFAPQQWNKLTGIFPSTFLQPVNCSKNSILNWVLKLNLFIFFSFFVYKTSLKGPIHLFFLVWFRYLQKCINESCVHLSGQFFSKNSHKTLKFHEKYIFQWSADLNLKNFPFGVYYRATPQGNWTKQTVKKLNLQGKWL